MNDVRTIYTIGYGISTEEEFVNRLNITKYFLNDILARLQL
jgi:hypothetical protein